MRHGNNEEKRAAAGLPSKTPEVIRAVGLDRLLLESDWECATPILSPVFAAKWNSPLQPPKLGFYFEWGRLTIQSVSGAISVDSK